jgi:hypothetical protein
MLTGEVHAVKNPTETTSLRRLDLLAALLNCTAGNCIFFLDHKHAWILNTTKSVGYERTINLVRSKRALTSPLSDYCRLAGDRISTYAMTS